MDRRIIIAVVMLVIWAIATFRGAPGWIHGLLTAGMFLLIYGIVKRTAGDSR